jgi:pimeloyl-ACP methyl ester carboxylesterase
MAKDILELMHQLGYQQVSLVGHDIGLMVAYAYAAQYPGEVGKVVLMDAFLPGVGDWKSVWLMRDLWHFHFYGETPLALVKGRERTYFEHFWNDFAADRANPFPKGTASFTLQLTRGMTGCGQVLNTSKTSNKMRKTLPSSPPRS